MKERGPDTVRDAKETDLAAIIEIAKATGQQEDWPTVFPAYVRHLIAHGKLLIGIRNGQVIGFGGTRQIGARPRAVSMLTDLFVDPAAHGMGIGRAMLDVLWGDEPRKMTFSSLHSNALPLYTSFGVDAWWPLLYLGGEVSRLEQPAGWSVESARPADGRAHVCLPAPHQAVRRLLAVGWKVSDLDVYMASEPGLIDPLSSVPSPALA